MRPLVVPLYDEVVRSLAATLLLLVISLPLLPLQLPVAGEDGLPACCRKDGQHRCAAMARMKAARSGPQLVSHRSPCASYPLDQTGAKLGKSWVVTSIGRFAVELASAPIGFASFPMDPVACAVSSVRDRAPPAVPA